MKSRSLMLIATVLWLAAAAAAQSGGSYAITQSVIAGGGGGPSTGGTFSLTGTIGQSIAGGASSGGSFAVQPGFWTAPVLAPTAATVAISGRVFDAIGNPLANTLVTLSDGSGSVIVTRTNSFGYFSFDEVMSGQTYLVDLSAKGRQFVPQVITVRDSLTGLEFHSLN